MNKRNDIRWLWILFTGSQLLLTGFVTQWLVSQYKAEKSMLVQTLDRQYFESQDQVIDSLLLYKVVNPAIMFSGKTIKDSAGKVSSDTMILTRAAGMSQFKALKHKGQSNTVITVSSADTLAPLGPDSQKIRIAVYPRQDLLIRTVQLVINETADYDTVIGQRTNLYPGRPDTVLFKTVFTDRIEQGGMRLGFSWISDTAAQTVKGNQSRIILKNPVVSDFPVVQISKVGRYLLNQVLPQLAFGVILLLLTGSAFIITFRSIRKQLMVNTLRNEFVGNISHELKTPVSTVKVALEALKTFDFKRDPEKTSEYLDMAAAEMNRLDKLVSKVLDQSLLQENQRIIRPETVNLGELVESVIKTMKPRIDAEQAEVAVKKVDPDISVEADPLYIQSVLVNLIDNSLKYAGPQARIVIRTGIENRHAFLSVSDSGPGIPREYRSRIFDQFFRVPSDNRHNVKGYGLGLSFADMVMKQHGGSIRLENPDSGGARFVLTFPQPAG